MIDQRCRFLDILVTNDRFRAITADMCAGRVAFVIEFLYLGVFGDVYQHRAGPAAFSDIKCFGNNFRNFPCIGYLVIPLGYRGSDVDHIGFLESIGPQQVRKNLGR